MSKKLIVLGTGAALLLPFVAFAQVITIPPSPITNIDQVINILRFVTYIIFSVLLIAAIGFILYAAFKYLTAMGDTAKVMEAHKALLWAAVAIAVALIARGVESVVRNILERGR